MIMSMLDMRTANIFPALEFKAGNKVDLEHQKRSYDRFG